jgi:hypothetical protein
MPTLRITNEAALALYDQRRPEARWAGQGVQRSDGSWDVPFDVDTIRRLEQHRFAGETMSDAIIRLCSTTGARRAH